MAAAATSSSSSASSFTGLGDLESTLSPTASESDELDSQSTQKSLVRAAPRGTQLGLCNRKQGQHATFRQRDKHRGIANAHGQNPQHARRMLTEKQDRQLKLFYSKNILFSLTKSEKYMY